MTMKKSYLLTPISCLLLLSMACGPEPQIPDPYCADRGCPVYEIPEDFKAWFMVPQEGATYLMQDSLTGRTERLRVVNRIDNYQPRVNHEAENSMAEYQGDSIYTFQLEVGVNPRRVRLQTKIGAQINQIWRNEGEVHFSPERLIGLYDSVEVLGVTYHQVVEVKAETYGGVFQRLWFAKKVGIILIDYQGTYERSTFLLTSYQPE